MVTEYFDDIVYQFLFDNYPTYRNALPDPTVLPAPDKITWREGRTDINTVSFNVLESETITSYKYLGSKIVEYVTFVNVRIFIKWTLGGKPPFINEFKRFLQITINTNQTAQYFRDRGIHHIQEGRSAIGEPDNPESDNWVFNMSVPVYQALEYS